MDIFHSKLFACNAIVMQNLYPFYCVFTVVYYKTTLKILIVGYEFSTFSTYDELALLLEKILHSLISIIIIC